MDKNENLTFGTDFYVIGNLEYEGYCFHILCRNGIGFLKFNGLKIRLQKNDVMIYSNPELVSDLKAEEGLEIEFVAIRTSFINSILPANRYGIGGRVSLMEEPVMSLTEEEAADLHDDMEHIRRRISGSHTFFDSYIAGLAQAMIYDLYDFHFRRNHTVDSTDSAANLMRRLIDMLNAGIYKMHRDVSFYAAELNVTPKHLSETVKRLSGQTVTELVVLYTIPEITKLLKNSQLSISQIADALNFTSVSYFSRYCLKHLGMSPAAYRSAKMPAKKKLGNDNINPHYGRNRKKYKF